MKTSMAKADPVLFWLLTALGILFVLLALSGCGSNPTAPVVTSAITAEVPVAVRCKVKYPTRPDTLGAKDLNHGLYSDSISLILEGTNYRLYSKELEAALAKCADDDPSASK